MLARRIIPCLDVDQGRVVKGIRFLDLVDAGDPVEQAIRYDAEGADELVFLDITASSERRALMADMLRRVADQVFIPLTVGGGIRTVEDMESVLGAGADKVSINSAALRDPSLLSAGARRFGSQAIVLAVDAKQVPGTGEGGVPPRWEIYSHGGRHTLGRDLLQWVREAVERGAGEILLTSMDRDGTGEGYDLAQLRAVSQAVRVPVIASGGAGSCQHLIDALDAGAAAVLAASIFHFGQLSIPQVKGALRRHGVVLR